MIPIERLQALVRIPTISRLDGTTDWSQFDRFIAALPELYPRLHAELDREIIESHSLLYRWRGPTATDPTVLMAHYDVVPATDDGWAHGPFDGHVESTAGGDIIWGRGTLDDKGALTAILEAVETAVTAGFRPARDIYLSFGHDEETAGSGAQAIVNALAERGIRPALVIDEGGAVVEGVFPGLSVPTAVVGVSEKGLITAELTVAQNGGHASTPPRMAATVRLARAILRLNRKPFRPALTAVNLDMLHSVGAHARQPYRWLFTQTWLTRPVLIALFARLSDETNALIRTTRVVTQLSGSQAANAMAERAVATVNIRVAVGSTVAKSIEHIRRAIHDPAVSIDIIHSSEPSPVSPTTGSAWARVAAAIADAYPDAIVTPYVMLAASDSRHFTAISEHVYRFSPFRITTDERGTLHATNEAMHVDTFLRGIRFYERLIESS